jgi:hypothetical protein
MQTTASLPAGSMRAFLQQRILFDGAYMTRECAMTRLRQTTRSWEALATVIDAPEMPIDDDAAWRPWAPDDEEIFVQDGILAEQLRRAQEPLVFDRPYHR